MTQEERYRFLMEHWLAKAIEYKQKLEEAEKRFSNYVDKLIEVQKQ